MSHKLATRAEKTKKGNLAQSQIPFEYCDGAEGGTRTPTGFPTTPSSRCNPIIHWNHFVYQIVTTMPKLHIP
jgi:hypothetical protein